MVLFMAVIRPLHEIGDPADARFRQCHLHRRITTQRLKVEPVRGAEGDGHRHRGDISLDRRFQRRMRRRIADADMQAEGGVIVVTAFQSGSQ